MARILCVDDEPNVLAGLNRALSREGHEVLTASSEEEALEAAAQHRPDLMILDVMMPEGTEGFHVVWKLRQMEEEGVAQTPVIMATGIHDKTELRFRPDESLGPVNPAEFLPIQAWLDKPYSNEELYSAVERVLGG
ncbi:MAG: response regulator [Armatimonadota bacterium]|nr:response regulator [Armatimonadota bacterium]